VRNLITLIVVVTIAFASGASMETQALQEIANTYNLTGISGDIRYLFSSEGISGNGNPKGSSLAAIITKTKELSPYIIESSLKENVYAFSIEAMIAVQSGGRQNVKSACGAIGVMQIMTITALDLGYSIQDLGDPAKNIMIGAEYISWMYRYNYVETPVQTAVGYIAGIKRAKKNLEYLNLEIKNNTLLFLGMRRIFANL